MKWGEAMSDPKEHLPGELPQAEFERLVQQLNQEEAQAREARLSSVESLRRWISQHPALQQPTLMETVAVYGPALLEILRRVMGL
jgi:hypothetical protein